MNFKQYIKNNAYKSRWGGINNILKNLTLRQGAKFLDVGCADGNATIKYANTVGIKRDNIYGLDINDDFILLAKEKFKVFKVDFEKDIFPFENNYFDLIIIDQVFEHIKNIENLTKEISRVLVPNGYLVVSTPNLASLHNRFLLLFGRQPSCINIFSEHIRGFTKEALKKFILNNIKDSKAISFKGVGFYPFLGFLAKILAKVFPNLSVYIVFLFKK